MSNRIALNDAYLCENCQTIFDFREDGIRECPLCCSKTSTPVTQFLPKIEIMEHTFKERSYVINTTDRGLKGAFKRWVTNRTKTKRIMYGMYFMRLKNVIIKASS